MNDNDDQRTDDERWPGVKYAYDFVLPSYTWATTRLETIVGRVQTLLTFAATVTLGFPILGVAVNKGIKFTSGWFMLALFTFAAQALIGMVARELGSVILMNPGKLLRSGAHLTEWEFKYYALFYAGQHFEQNVALSNRKAWLGSIMSGLLAIEILAFLMWLATEF